MDKEMTDRDLRNLPIMKLVIGFHPVFPDRLAYTGDIAGFLTLWDWPTESKLQAFRVSTKLKSFI